MLLQQAELAPDWADASALSCLVDAHFLAAPAHAPQAARAHALGCQNPTCMLKRCACQESHATLCWMRANSEVQA